MGYTQEASYPPGTPAAGTVAVAPVASLAGVSAVAEITCSLTVKKERKKINVV